MIQMLQLVDNDFKAAVIICFLKLINLFIYLIFGCIGSLLPHEGFL